MSKKNLRKKFSSFVSKLTPDQVREQLVLAYLQMEKCQQVLKGKRVQPAEMLDNGESSDLELFYSCVKVREELDSLNKSECKHDGKKITIGVDVDYSEAINSLKDLKKELEKLCVDKKKSPRPTVYVMKVDLEKYFKQIHFDAKDLAIHKQIIDYYSQVDQLLRGTL